MPLDPVTAVGLGAGILQIIDFTTKLVDAGREITQSLNGATVEHCDIEAVTRSLVLLLRQVVGFSGQGVPQIRSRYTNEPKFSAGLTHPSSIRGVAFPTR
ncbi:uncharacterized protein PgNI_03108 [Pyricularia grisea]|uniref:Uncharacterized protein n=1 Tax=Pyricularia grisea TaxID=148305 RepID=A0A6P8BE59_PYRGI|nr:uncharacterized protein PgNI_03108 [Pyricularia grisea]TLD14090.1 hypothetical protein PgNI_03108 [Pyricularia grisea]